MEDQCQIENREPEIENHESKIENARRGIGGPKTEEGKRRSARNAMKYGIYASTEEGLAVLEQTIGCSYAEMLDRMRSCLNPRDALQAIRALQAKRDKECEKSKNELRSIPFHAGLHP